MFLIPRFSRGTYVFLLDTQLGVGALVDAIIRKSGEANGTEWHFMILVGLHTTGEDLLTALDLYGMAVSCDTP